MQGMTLGLGLGLTHSTAMGGGGEPSALTFPAQGARFDIDAVGNQTFGGVQPYTDNTNDGRFFRQQITPNLPTYAENADGSLVRFNATVVRRSTRGILIEPVVDSGQQPILWTNDLTQTPWVKTNITAVKNQTGRNNIVNSASLITATADGGTVLYPLTLAASTRNLYADIKRVTGTGTLEITLDGVTWVAVTLNKPRYNGWGRYGLPLTTVTNPSFGFRIGTSGDAFAISFVTSDLSAYELSPWDTFGTARRRQYDRPSTSISGGIATSVSSGLMEFIRTSPTWGIYMEWDSMVSEHFLFGQVLCPFADGHMQFTTDDNQSGGAQTVVSPPGLVRVTTDRGVPRPNKAYGFVQDGVCKLCVNGSEVFSGGTQGGPYTVLDHKDLGSNAAGTKNMVGFVPRIAILDTPWSDAEATFRTAVPA